MLAFAALLLSSLLYTVHAVGEVNTRLGNRTIERVLASRAFTPASIHALLDREPPNPFITRSLHRPGPAEQVRLLHWEVDKLLKWAARWWDFGADSYIGWLWSRLALTPHNFIIEAEFKISGDSSHLFGDGLALWLTTERAQPGPVFGSKDRFNGLAIVIDTYANGRHSYSFPRISAFLNDGNTDYDFNTDGEAQAIGACSANVRRTNVATKLQISYIKGEFLDVKVQYKAWDDWSDCFYVENITLPSNPFLGFTAMTGDVSDAHDIVSVSTSSAVLSAPDSQRDKMQKSSVWRGANSAESTWFGFLFKLALFFGVVAGCVYGWQQYQRNKRYGGFGGTQYGGTGAGTMFDSSSSGRFGGPYANGRRF